MCGHRKGSYPRESCKSVPCVAPLRGDGSRGGLRPAAAVECPYSQSIKMLFFYILLHCGTGNELSASLTVVWNVFCPYQLC